MEMKPGYRHTELGLIPEDWKITNLGTVAGLDVGYAFRSTWFQEHDGVPLLRGENVGYGHPDWSDTRRLAEAQAASFSAYRLRSGDVVIGMDRTFTKSGSKISVIQDADCPCLLVQRVGRFVPKGCDNRFLWAVISSARFQQSLLAEQKGMDIPHLSRAEILRPIIPLPPTRVEQEAIAEALSDAGALIESLEQLLAKKRQVKQGGMQELLTGKNRLPGFSEEWKLKRLGEIAHIKTGGRNNQDKVEDGAYPFFVRSATVERINSYSYDCEAILVPGEGAIANIFHYVSGRFDVHQRVYAITQFSPATSGRFVYFYMAEKFGAHATQNSVKATVDSLRLPTFQNFEVAMPPTVEEQEAITGILSDMDAEIVALEAKLAKARQIRQSMMQELLTGRIRLI